MSHYLTTLRLTLGGQTLYDGLSSLEPGHRLTFERGRISIDSYWTRPDAVPPEDFNTAAEQFEQRLREAVKIRLAGDVPTGIFMSGGVDSNLVARFAAEEFDTPLPASCGIAATESQPGGDDSYAAEAARCLGFPLNRVPVGPEEYRAVWQELITSYATPVSTPTDVVLTKLAAVTRSHAGFVLGGEGADELLCGYAVPHFSGRDYDNALSLNSGTWTGSSRSKEVFRSGLSRWYRQQEFSSRADHYFCLNSLIPTAAKGSLFQPSIWEAAGRDEPMRSWYEEQFQGSAANTGIDAMTRVLHRVNLESLLHRLDSATMRFGLEVRSVYTDVPLMEMAFRLPEQFKIGVSEEESAPFLTAGDLAARGSLLEKRLLRQVAQRVLPTRLANRPKASFPTPIASWLGTQWGRWASETLRQSRFAREMFQPAAIEEIAQAPQQAGIWLWPLLNLSMWGDEQF